jgi:XTP/dITP diphosphohydrolase
MTSYIFASSNQGKFREVHKVLHESGLNITLPSRNIYVAEGETSYLENAIAKAEGYYRELHQPVLADDSGLEVDCLSGQPGVISAVYAGENASSAENIDLLLNRIREVVQSDKKVSLAARYRSIVVVFDGHRHTVGEGIYEGQISPEKRGNGGFGYDPVFVPSEDNPGGLTLAELKDRGILPQTHRIKALKDLINKLTANQ